MDLHELESLAKEATGLRGEYLIHTYAHWLFHPFQLHRLAGHASEIAHDSAASDWKREFDHQENQKANIAEMEKIKTTLQEAGKTITELGEKLKAKNLEAEAMKINITALNEELEDYRKTPPPLSTAERREMKEVRKENFLLKQQLNAPIESSTVFKSMREELLALVANKDTQINLMQDVLEKQMKKCESSVKDCELLFAKLREVAKRVAFLENEVIIPMYHALDKFGDEGLKIIERRAEARAALSQSSGGNK
jgi:hypothetical protein